MSFGADTSPGVRYEVPELFISTPKARRSAATPSERSEPQAASSKASAPPVYTAAPTMTMPTSTSVVHGASYSGQNPNGPPPSQPPGDGGDDWFGLSCGANPLAEGQTTRSPTLAAVDLEVILVVTLGVTPGATLVILMSLAVWLTIKAEAKIACDK